MHRFYVPWTFRPGATVVLSGGQAAQVARVLRLRPGELIETFDGRGAHHLVELTTVRPISVHGVVREASVVDWPFPWRVTLHLSLIRPQRFEWAVEKAAELGAGAIVPMLSERCTHGDAGTGGTRLARWQQIAVEAAEQCGSAFVPEVRPVCSFPEALSRSAGLRLFAWEGVEHDRRLLLEALESFPATAGGQVLELVLFVGPEGGFTPGEVQAARDAGCTFVSLGPLTLRAETAAVAALAVLAQLPTSRHDSADGTSRWRTRTD